MARTNFLAEMVTIFLKPEEEMMLFMVIMAILGKEMMEV